MVQGVLSRRKEKSSQKRGRQSITQYKKGKRSCTSEEKHKRQIRNRIEEHLKERSKRI
ncbi:hypothetical protein NEMIN01_1392 [Nematocida minor]|uniref:uncharacterized protein n=1 Tax=Nematocida minor TaxID=1912983 RepID=UPI00221F7DCB|nr:uncharacterized protein NEMIN01_1392 [Nematocida minor]KAI5191184.1 hypothetical protein NEMIN01_1392 [Nematocida minor]